MNASHWASVQKTKLLTMVTSKFLRISSSKTAVRRKTNPTKSWKISSAIGLSLKKNKIYGAYSTTRTHPSRKNNHRLSFNKHWTKDATYLDATTATSMKLVTTFPSFTNLLPRIAFNKERIASSNRNNFRRNSICKAYARKWSKWAARDNWRFSRKS